MLELKKVNAFLEDAHIMWDVSLQVSSGEIVCVIGPNGAGKSTLLKAIVNLLPGAESREGRGRSGEIFFQGKNLDGLLPEDIVQQGIALVPEGARVFPEMTVLDNLKMGSYFGEAKTRRKETLEEVFQLFPRLRERLEQTAKTLSGGERQMLAIGRAIMSRPSLLLLDEPSLGLEPGLVQKTFAAVAEINRRGVSILLVEQNVQYSLEISRRAYVLENGRVVLEGNASDLLGSDHIRKTYLAI